MTPGTDPVETVLVTGGLGLLGRSVVDDLAAHGYRVVILDRVRASENLVPTIRSLAGEVTDVGQVTEAMRGCDAVVHLAAIPAPYGAPDSVVFGNNTGATFAVLQAAALLGVRRIAMASSGSAYGTAWSPQPTTFDYVPVDEAHPFNLYDAYGLSKEVDERTAEMFCRREGMSVAALRFHWVASREMQLTALAERRGRRDREQELRNLWGYVDLRDAARACRLAIEAARGAPYGFQPMNIVAADTLSEQPVEELLADIAPGVEVRSELTGDSGCYAIDRAAAAIGWRPEYTWRRID